MSNDRIESRIETLTEEKREQFENRLEDEEPELYDELLEKHRDTIKNQMIDDREELSNFNIVVSGFQNRNQTDYTYIRTEPFIHENKPNFDLLIASQDDGIAVLVEYERTLASRTDEKVDRFGTRKEFVETGGDDDLDADRYLEEVLSTGVEAIDYVLSSQHTPQDRLTAAGERKGLSFCVWDLADHGVRCSIYYYPVKEEQEASFNGHTDDALETYIIEELANRVPKHDYLHFTFSSSNYLKVKHMAVVLVTRYHEKGNDTFTYTDWEHLFAEQDIELNNYLDEEKEAMYRKFISHGEKWNIVTLEKDRGDVLKNGYRIKSNATTDVEKLENELEKKMAEHRMQDDFGEQLRDLKKQLIENIHSTGRTTLSDFTDIE